MTPHNAETFLAWLLAKNITGTRDAQVILHLLKHGRCALTPLATLVGCTCAGMTMIADRLEKTGVGRRHPDPKDRMTWHLDLLENSRFELTRLFSTP